MKGKYFISILIMVLIFLPLAPFAKEKPKLAKKYGKWLKEEVIYIITPVEKEVFSKLETDRDRDLFMEEFWRQRDPTPGTPRNEFKEEHFRRIEFANKKFGRGTPFKGWRTDRGRFYIKLGRPSYVERYMDPDVHPIEIWYYSGNPKFVRASFFRLLFFQRYGGGEFELYNQFLDGPKSLVTYLEKKLGGVDERLDPDARAAIILEREVSFELAEAAISAFPGQKGQGGLASQILLGEVETIPHKKVNDDYAIKFLEHKAVVEVSYSVHYIGNQYRVNLIQDPSGLFFVNYILVPDTLSLDFFKDKYFTNLKTSVRVTDEAGKTIFQGERNTPIELRKEELKVLEKRSFHLHDSFPLVPGNYTMNLLWENMVTKEFTSVEKKISIPEGKELHMSGLVLARKVSRDLPKSQESRAFQLGKLQIYPSVNNIFQKEDSLFLFLQIYGLNHNLKQDGILEFSFSQEERTLQTIIKNISEYNSDRDFLEEIPLEKLKPGKYTVKVSLLDQKGEIHFSETERFSIITEPIPGSWVVAQTNPPADDPYYAYIMGVQYLNKGELQRAQMELADAYARKPDALDYALSYARVLLTLKDFQRVKEILIPFVEAKQEDFGLFYSLGNASQEIGEFGEAISYYQRALNLKGNITLILNAMGECYFQLGETEQALQTWKKSLDTNPHQENIKKLIENLKEKY